MMEHEHRRLTVQAELDAGKTQAERNRLGQFATPTALALEMLEYARSLLDGERVRFLDPAFGTGSFFSALLDAFPAGEVESAAGFEIDPHYGEPAVRLWHGTSLRIRLEDFTQAEPPAGDAERANLIVCNPPYVRHHHIANGEKLRLQNATESASGVRIAGLSGLYCYFLGLAHAWLAEGGVAGWLIPSEFMDVNYGHAVKRYLLDRVTLLRIHRFDPSDVQFGDALVSSAVVWFRRTSPPEGHSVEFTFGGSLFCPQVSRLVSVAALRQEAKWTRFPLAEVRTVSDGPRLSDFFTAKRGIATGSNRFFVLTRERITELGLPLELFRPILPSPRFLPNDEIMADADGNPLLDRQLYVLDCRLPEEVVQSQYPALWQYLETGKDDVAEGYLCRSRSPWYAQESRPPSPFLCTYMGRANGKGECPFRFILNHSQATAANVYLLLYPKPAVARALQDDKSLARAVWEALNRVCASHIVAEGRVYGGGLHKLEPRELGNVPADEVAALLPSLPQRLDMDTALEPLRDGIHGRTAMSSRGTPNRSASRPDRQLALLD